MADNAAITSAHAHARRAAEVTSVDWVQATQEHEYASSDFARAARSTSDSEALRVLRLLEDQHQKLARIIKGGYGSTQAPPQEPPKPAVKSRSTDEPAVAASDSDKLPDSKSKKPSAAPTEARIGSHARDSSPSLAREIASRRGIPQHGQSPLSAAAQARARQLSPESRRRNMKSSITASKVPPSVVESQATLQAQAAKAKKAEEDDKFARFYSSITTGTMSKLSSALAYAGLPLNAEDVKEATPPAKGVSSVRANDGPNVKRIFSKAALEAVEEDNRSRGKHGHFGPAESFYVVPSTGMTQSFAQIAKRHSGLGDLAEEDEGEFVDAREAQAPPSPKHHRSGSSAQKSRRSSSAQHTQEEIELENATMKETLSHMAERLRQFEMHAQDANMAALTHSVASVRAAGATGAGDAERIKLLEQEAERRAEEYRKLEALAAKQEKQLKLYKVKYDGLKEGAKAKQKAKEAELAAAKVGRVAQITADDMMSGL
ncbi:hypothetical protein Tdes44962_MAKER00400 [Teratosphaeria destructans]|uniref:Uncharacterized protein n=1 Tax=Teratosphaeria destructans TaxID=418781 RepID=A0A9W7SRY4_9PEZI|nr:hypothetical protein Tdes44962_MAKER00400 [Teratosphaeria destructans]